MAVAKALSKAKCQEERMPSIRTRAAAAAAGALLGLASAACPAAAAPPATPGWLQVAAGQYHACAIQTGRTLWCWGSNVFGQAGIDSSLQQQDTPARVGARSGWAQVSAGGDYSCAIRADGTLWCWGLIEWQAGSWESLRPVQIGTGFAQVSLGATEACAVRDDHTLWCWGDNSSGQLGTGSGTGGGAFPQQVGSYAGWARVAAGGQHVCAVRSDGSLWCWGDNTSGQLGTGSLTPGQEDAPVRVGTAANWAQAAAGAQHTCAIRTDGTLWCWGDGLLGQLGDRATADSASPVQVGTRTNWTAVTAGDNHTCALHADPTLWCWGQNYWGQLGIGTTSNVKRPMPVGTSPDWLQAVASSTFTCAVRRDRTLWCWGRNDNGQLGIGAAPSQENAPAQVG